MRIAGRSELSVLLPSEVLDPFVRPSVCPSVRLAVICDASRDSSSETTSIL